MGMAIGIDLGTSNCTAAIYRKGKIESIPIEGRKILPSVVSCKDDGRILVGGAAKSRLYIDPENTVASSKRFIGDPGKVYHIQHKTLTPVDIAQEILQKIKQEASSYLGEEVTDAVITIPAYFTEEQREATKKAGERAGLNVLRLLAEPTAAAIAYGLDKERNQTIMVYDLGGGTFDVSILKVENNSFKVIAVDGDAMLGGDDVDELIVQHLLNKIKTAAGSNQSVQGSLSLQRIKEAAEEAKKELSESDVVDISLPDIFGIHIEEELDIEIFNHMIEPLLHRTIHKIEEVLQSAGLTKREISRVILVGGSTRMKAVQEAVTEQIKKPYIADNVDEVVAYGAAIMAANLSVPDLDSTPVPIIVEEVTAHSFGVDMIDTSDHRLKVFHLIKKNTRLPCTGATIGSTLRPYQPSIRAGVFRTESIMPAEEAKLGELHLPVSIRPYHVSVVSLFELDEDGILTFSTAEIAKGSPLLSSYRKNKEVDLQLLHSMIHQGEIVPQKIVIDTKKTEV
ncbi:Hsp70 family protein [Priestia abyssalis]|uniref:Hsp70 family protein n=1 Tax=Priestia abyssalis TaxID=1221450 RepID=UPI001475CABC|nr:Hsp70 family protein [Priestia abyssalis]